MKLHQFNEYIKYAPTFTEEESYKVSVVCSEQEGLVLDFGTATGGWTNFLAECMPMKKVHTFDSFRGLPEAWNGHDIGTFKVEELPKFENNVTVHIGMFEETIPEFIKKNREPFISLLNVDCDLYSSTKTIFTFLGNRIKHGTIIRFDEFHGYEGWEAHEHKAFKEFLDETNLDVDLLGQGGQYSVIFRISHPKH